ncbi:MAG: radical SAM protein, partial [Clostridiaceae bacterium]|nr:radical SAM protein [Clostridiaceae bacterium]
MKKLGLYIHIPFCIQKCNYCDFLSFEHIKEEDMNSYADAAAAEIENKSTMLKDHIIDTIFLGGGTPSVLNSESLEKIIQAVFKYFKVSDSKEFTIEANPKTFNKEKLSHYLHLGINRLSMGVQSLEDDILKMLGRIHSSQDFFRSYYEAREVGFSNVNTD